MPDFVSRSLIRLEAVSVDFAEDCTSADSRVVTSSTDVNLAVRDGGNREFHGVAGRVARNLRTVPKFGGEVRGIEGMQDRGARAGPLLLVPNA